jgi:hypothetical protein
VSRSEREREGAKKLTLFLRWLEALQKLKLDSVFEMKEEDEMNFEADAPNHSNESLPPKSLE